MDLVHSAHLTIVLVPRILQVFNPISLLVRFILFQLHKINVCFYFQLRSYENDAFDVILWRCSAYMVLTHITIEVCCVSGEMSCFDPNRGVINLLEK